MSIIFDTLEDTAKYIVDSLDFTPETLNKAFSTVFYKDKKIVFDTYSLSIHENELDYEDRRKLFIEINNYYVYFKEREKERFERSCLVSFLIDKDLLNAVVRKQVRPDFELISNDKLIGVEITELKAKDIAIQNKIIRNASGKNLTKEELIDIGKKTSATKYNIFNYDSVNGHASIGSMFDVNEHKDEFVSTLESKILKYDKMVERYDEFYIIAKSSEIEITSEMDALDVLRRLDKKPKSKMYLYLEYEDNRGYSKVYECDLNNIS